MLGKIIGSLVSLLLVVGVVIGVVVVMKSSNHPSADGPPQDANPTMKMVTTICEPTTYKDACARSLEPVTKNSSATARDYIFAAISATLEEVKKSYNVTSNTVVNKDQDQYNHMAVEDCKDLLDSSIQTLQASISVVGDSDLHTVQDRANELWSWMTGVYSLQESCLDQIEKPEYKSAIENGMVNATQLTHNAISILGDLDKLLSIFNLQPAAGKSSSRRLMTVNDGYPSWLGAAERRLLWKTAGVTPNAVVAKDGSGRFKTINQAVAAYPKNLKGRYIIYVKAGVYDEQVIIDKKKPNIFIYGDGMGKTIVTGRKNYGIMHVPTMQTASFATAADGFIAQGMTFRNEAGPEGHQAVAFRSQADRTVMFDCSFEGNQDTLYYQAFRQFYRNCHIYGTVDFIFGMGQAVIQESLIIVRRPMPKQSNTVTADGKTTGSGGLVIQNCRIVPDKFLFPVRFQIASYLGRPWKANALTVTMQSEIGDFIRPEGYELWQGEPNHKTCEMYEYGNTGPGAATGRRNKNFSRFKVLGAQEAAKYTAGSFLQGGLWIPQTGVPNKLGL